MTSTTAKFVPNSLDNCSIEERINSHAALHKQDPETVVVIPFTELEGELVAVNTNLTVEGKPVTMDMVGGGGYPIKIEQETPTLLGEKLAEELASFDPPHPTKISNQTVAQIVRDGPILYSVISSEEDITRLEQKNFSEGHQTLRCL